MQYSYRRFKKSDLNQLYDHFESQIEIMKWTSLRRITTKEESKKRLNEILLNESMGNTGVWGLFSQKNDLLAWLMLKETDLNYPEIGYMVNKEYHNQGIGSLVLNDIIEYSLGDLELSGISARVLKNNNLSKSLLLKAGFKLIKGKDLLIYELKR